MRWSLTSAKARWLALAGASVLAMSVASCGTIDLGDNIVPPDLQLDEDFFYCVIQPQVISAKSCAGGGAGEGGMCHSERSALRLVDTPADAAPMCDAEGNVIGGSLSADYIANFEAVQFTVQSDPGSSPFYRRPTAMDSHPRQIFGAEDECAMLIAEWINRGAL